LPSMRMAMRETPRIWVIGATSADDVARMTAKMVRRSVLNIAAVAEEGEAQCA
jgi:hypothetical protein